MSYIAYIDLLGISASATEPSVYKSKIRDFTIELSSGSGFLREGSKLRYFSDCAYIQADDLNGLVDFLTYLRDSLLLSGTYLTAAIKEGVLNPQEVEKKGNRICDVQGVSFFGEDIANLYHYHSEFKGAGIRIDEPLADLLNDYLVVDSFFVPEVALPGKRESVRKYKDIAFSTKHSDNAFNSMFISTLNDALLAGSQDPRFGRNYVPLLITFMKSRPQATIEWNLNGNPPLTCTSSPCEMIFQLSLGWNKVKDLFGLHYLSLVLLDIIYNETEHNYLSADDRKEALSLLLRSGILSSKYERISEMPTDFYCKETDIKIRKDYLHTASAEILNFH